MTRNSLPDHAGRMPDHPRYGNPSAPAEEAERVGKARDNLVEWQRKTGAEFSGGVSMSYGDGPTYKVPIGDREIAQKIVSRPLPPKPPTRALPEPAEAAPEPPPVTVSPPRSWFVRLIIRIKGAFRWT